jgi:ketosteroid isomerase-like protein
MKRISPVVVIAVALSMTAMAAVSARGQGTAKKKSTPTAKSTSASVEDQLKKMEKDRADAVIRVDIATLEGLTSDDYTLINANGQFLDRAQTMNAIKSGDIKITANEVSDLKVRVYGNTAVVTGRSDAKGTMGGRDIKGPVRFTRVYVKKSGHWQSVAFQQTPVLNP